MEKNINILSNITYFIPVIVWAAVIFTFSSLQTAKTSDIYWQDFIVKKAAHLFVYAVFAVLLFRYFINTGTKQKKAYLLAVIFSFFYGVSDEIHQSFTPGREPTLRDVIFDTIGASLGIYFIWKLLPKMPKRLQILAKKLQLV